MSDSDRTTVEELRVVALLSAYNEEDVVAQVVGDAIDQGVLVYFLDDGSTDATLSEVEPFLDRGLIGIESLPQPQDGVRRWRDVLVRKEELARELEADWFMSLDADELRESPWADLRLSEALARVDRLGYNAVDFEVLDFWPVAESCFEKGQDLRSSFPYFEYSPSCNRLQVRAWKNLPGGVALASSGGHEAVFHGRKIFPVRFLLRHYPVRGQAHGERKVLKERRHRFDPSEREAGWHVQYDHLLESKSDPAREATNFVRCSSELSLYDEEEVRFRLFVQPREIVEQQPVDGDVADASRLRLIEKLKTDLDRSNRLREALDRELHERNQELSTVHRELDQRSHEVEALHQELHRSNLSILELQSKLDRFGSMRLRRALSRILKGKAPQGGAE